MELCHNNVWGTVCDDYWSSNDGIVACRQLGLRFVAVTSYAYFGRGTGQIWLDNLHCTGSETQLIYCRHNGFGAHNCGHYEDAGLFCEGNQLVCICKNFSMSKNTQWSSCNKKEWMHSIIYTSLHIFSPSYSFISPLCMLSYTSHLSVALKCGTL